MNNSMNNLIIYNGYPLSVVIAVSFHALVLSALLYFQSNSRPEVLELVQPTVIKALFIDENPQVVNARALERQRVERLDEARRNQEREQQREQEQQREAEAEQLRQEQAREQQRERSALLERQEQNRLAEELEQQQRDREADQQRQRELAEDQRRREQQERDRERDAEAAQAATAEAARTEFELIQSATALIQQLVQETWSRPPSARNGMRAVLRIRMLPTGELLEATITESSGDPAFDRSAENAVYRAAPFRELQQLPINVFTENFRSLSLIFQPEDLLN